MTYNKSLRGLLAIVAVALLFTACKKAKSWEPLGDRGQTLVKVLDGAAPFGYKSVNVDFIPEPQVIEMIDVRRDVANNAELNKPMTVIVQDDPGAVTTYDPTMLPLPAGSYTVGSATPLVGNSYTLTFAPGELAKQIVFTLTDATTLNLSSKYGMGFTITTIDGNGKIAPEQKTLVVEVGAKNDYDGVYQVSGTFFHPTNAALVGPFGTTSTGGPLECDLVTNGSNSVRRDYGAPVGESIIIFNSSTGNLTYFTGVKMRFAVNAATNAVTVTPSDAASAAVDSSPYNCTYNPSTRTFTLNYAWSAAGGQRVITEVLQYLRPR